MLNSPNFGLPDLPGMPDLGRPQAKDPDQVELGEILDQTLDPTAIPPGKRAVVYLRVSDPSQTKTSREFAHGMSMETQRQLCYDRADDLGLTVIEEYVEPGRSALSIEKRPVFRQMLARIQQQRDVDVVLVYMFERAGRNQWEDAIVGMAFQTLGVRLISVTEPMDNTPAGKAMRGMISVFNEMMSNSRGADIKRKMEAAAKRGQTLGRARLGYLNVRDISDGRDIRTIEIDPERSPFVKLAFELYATGEYGLNDIVEELTARGLTTRATAKHPAGPVSVNKVHQMLRDRYYLGIVTYQGEEFPGQHEPIIDQELFDQVQGIIRSRGHATERRREHHHFLKGTVYCGECWTKHGVERRLIIQRAQGRHGGEYFYYFCPGGRVGECSQPHHNLYRVEDAVENLYRHTHYDTDFLETMRTLLDDTVSDQDEAQRLLRKQLRDQITALDTQEENLLDLLGDPDVPKAKIKARLVTVERERASIKEQLTGVNLDLSAGARYLEASLALLENPHDLYKDATDEVRRRLNQAIFDRIFISDEQVSGVRMHEPHGNLFASEAAHRAARAGLEPEAIRATYSAAFAANTAPKQKAAQQGGLSSTTATTTAWAQIFTTASLDGVSNKSPMVEVLGTYSKQRGLENTAISVMEEARRCQERGPGGATPARNRNESPAGIRNGVRQRVRVLTLDEIDELVSLYLAGDSTYVLSRRFDIRRETVSAHLERRGIMRRLKRDTHSAQMPMWLL